MTIDPTGWRKSTYSQDGGACVEVRFDGDTVFIRDSKYLRDEANDPAAQPTIAVPRESWAAFLDSALGNGVVAAPGIPVVERRADGSVSLHGENGVTLTYTPTEWAAYTAGVRRDEFAAA
ncbi:DUF397 domain-containing protein [Nocardia cyriacigeorgica]|uniref:DUF397 domain-containing protein n=1 Tax=Nocardia cyriacigeorgica TaxID=135487 RepID=UPI002457F33E|nr:DUF397 domain-containing protein [Nocardia cyriacigeorgica]